MVRSLLSGLEAKAFASLMRAFTLHLLPHLMRQSLTNLRTRGGPSLPGTTTSLKSRRFFDVLFYVAPFS